MDAGKLRELVTIQQKSPTGTGGRGQPVYEWTAFANVYAEIESLTGKKAEIARQLVAEASHQITIRYLTGITTEMRVVDSTGATYQIGFVARGKDKLRYFFHILTCTEQLNGI